MNERIDDAQNSVSAVHVKAGEQDRSDLLRVQSGPEALGGRRSDLAELAMNRIYDRENRKKNDQTGLLRELQAVNQYIEKLEAFVAEMDERIAQLDKQRAEAARLAQQAFDDMHEIDDLIERLQSGKATAEDYTLASRLLGRNTQNESDDELIVLLVPLSQAQRDAGLEQTEVVRELDETIEHFKDVRDKAKNTLDQINSMPEEELMELMQSGSLLDIDQARQSLEDKVINQAVEHENDAQAAETFDTGFAPPSYD